MDFVPRRFDLLDAAGLWGNVLGERPLAVSRRELPANKDPRQPVDGLLPSRRATSLLDGRKFACGGSSPKIAGFLRAHCAGRAANDRHGHVPEGVEIASRPDALLEGSETCCLFECYAPAARCSTVRSVNLLDGPPARPCPARSFGLRGFLVLQFKHQMVHRVDIVSERMLIAIAP